MIITAITGRITDDICKSIAEGMFPEEIYQPGIVYVLSESGDNMITTTSDVAFPDYIVTTTSDLDS